MLWDLTEALADTWDRLPEADKGIMTAGALLFGLLLLMLVSAMFFVST